MRQQWLVFLPVSLATVGLAACASVLGGDKVKVRPVDMLAASASAGVPRDALYESAVAAINERDYGRALDYLQAAKAKDPRNVKALNALGVVYDKLGRFDLSARYYAQARAIEPDSRIVAENMGYSQVLQRLLNPNQPIAVATIDLPPDLIKPASPPAAEKTTLAAAAPAMPVMERNVIDTVPHVATAMPDARPSFAAVVLPEPAAPVTERKVIDMVPQVGTAMPFALPDAKPSLASIILPEPVMPVTERRVIDAPLPVLTATQFALPDTRPVFASIFYSEPVVTERKVVDAPRPALMATSLALTETKPFFATAVFPEPVMPVTEKKVIDTSPRTVTTAPFVLPDVKPLFAASLSSQPATVAENRMSPDSAPSAVLMSVPAKVVVASAPVEVRTVSVPFSIAAPTAKLIPAVSLPSMPVTEKPTDVPRPLPAVAVFTAPLPAKPVLVASVAPPTSKPVAVAIPAVAVSSPSVKSVTPTKQSIKKTVAILPAAAIAPRPAKVVPSPRPVMIVSHAAAGAVAPAPAKLRAPVLKQVAGAGPMSARTAPANKNGKILIGQPIRLFNASGRAGGTATVLRRLTALGWTMRSSEGRVQPATVLYYSLQNIAAAKALQRTLPFPVRLTADKASNAGMRLVIGRDYLAWKPRNARIAALWQKGMVLASLQKTSIKGVR